MTAVERAPDVRRLHEAIAAAEEHAKLRPGSAKALVLISTLAAQRGDIARADRQLRERFPERVQQPG